MKEARGTANRWGRRVALVAATATGMAAIVVAGILLTLVLLALVTAHFLGGAGH